MNDSHANTFDGKLTVLAVGISHFPLEGAIAMRLGIMRAIRSIDEPSLGNKWEVSIICTCGALGECLGA